MTLDAINQLAVNTVRTLSIDTTQTANSSHPGLPIGAVPMAYVFQNHVMNVNSKTNRSWSNRDRFVLSTGYGPTLLYSLLHLSGCNISIDDLKNFRQWGLKVPGYPEAGHTDGVEATTGPLGRGVANIVGMAMAEAHLATKFNKPGFNIIDHYAYALYGNGRSVGGVSREAANLVGHLKLGKLTLLYDSDDTSLDDPTSRAFTEDIKGKFGVYGWQHILIKDGDNLEAITKAIEEAKAETGKPSVIEVKTIIGFDAERQETSAVHGTPFGVDGIAYAKKSYGWEYPELTIPEGVTKHFEVGIKFRGGTVENEWDTKFRKYGAAYSESVAEYKIAFASKPVDVTLEDFETSTSLTSRSSDQQAIQQISAQAPSFWGGLVDLSVSDNTTVKMESDFQPDNYLGHNIWFGVRGFVMAVAINGITLHGGTRVHDDTFLVSSNYLLSTIRITTPQQLPVVYVMMHDSIAVGEDGPAHEPVEQLASVCSIPSLNAICPADGNETNAAWRRAFAEANRPTMLILARQSLPVLEGIRELTAEDVNKGTYILSEAKDNLDGILIAAGSKVRSVLDTRAALETEGVHVRVVSMSIQDIFGEQDAAHKESILPANVTKRSIIEAGPSFSRDKCVGLRGEIPTIDTQGASVPGSKIFEEYGFTVDNTVSPYESL